MSEPIEKTAYRSFEKFVEVYNNKKVVSVGTEIQMISGTYTWKHDLSKAPKGLNDPSFAELWYKIVTTDDAYKPFADVLTTPQESVTRLNGMLDAINPYIALTGKGPVYGVQKMAAISDKANAEKLITEAVQTLYGEYDPFDTGSDEKIDPSLTKKKTASKVPAPPSLPKTKLAPKPPAKQVPSDGLPKTKVHAETPADEDLEEMSPDKKYSELQKKYDEALEENRELSNEGIKKDTELLKAKREYQGMVDKLGQANTEYDDLQDKFDAYKQAHPDTEKPGISSEMPRPPSSGKKASSGKESPDDIFGSMTHIDDEDPDYDASTKGPSEEKKGDLDDELDKLDE